MTGFTRPKTLWFLLLAAVLVVAPRAFAANIAPGLDNAICLSCHKAGKQKIEVAGDHGEKRLLTPVDTGSYGKSVHATMKCVACHTDIVDAKKNHVKAAGAVKPDCAACHIRLWDEAKKNNQTKEKARLEVVAQNVAAYRQSFHARPDKDDPSRPMATCNDCHATHDFSIPRDHTLERMRWKLDTSKTCGEKCHEDQLEDLQTSVHGEKYLGKKDPMGAVCIDCHTSHQVIGTSSTPFKLRNVEACGTCHQEELHSYRDSYHGQVNMLGYPYTAKCSDCHGNHSIKRSSDPGSKTNEKNLLKTCRKCHDGKKPGMVLATVGYASFAPHANGHDFKRYPQVWIAAKFMQALLLGVFVFFWVHSMLWYYREQRRPKKIAQSRSQERRQRTAAHTDIGEKYVSRFPWGWRLAHLLFALAVMTLVLTGIPILFSYSNWGPVVVAAFGGPKTLGLIHRTAATVMCGIFFIHLIYVMQRLLRDRNFRWFGPDSLVPNWKDLEDCIAMFKWFVGKGPHPEFERWAYFEKFDYWAVFWGVAVIGLSGLMLAFPQIVAARLPGWTLNVAALIHSEEAFLAAVFLFTVHFFNNHFRPDKLPPPDVVMFTGTQSLEEFRHGHAAQYQRLEESGELEKCLANAPSRLLHISSIILGLALLATGLALLVLIGIGFFHG